MPENMSAADAERLSLLDALKVEGGSAPEGASSEHIQHLLRIQIARRRGLNVSDDVTPEKINKLTADRPIRHYHTNVVGVTFENADGSDRQEILSRCNILEHLVFEHDDRNRHHKNAVRVVRNNGEQIGHLNRDLADEVMAKSREGYTFSVFIKNLGGGPDSGENYWAKLLILEGKPGATPIDAEEYEKHLDMSDAGWVN